MNTPLTSRLRVAIAGLDLVSATRLKVACSLLMADRLEIQLDDWGSAPAAALVAHDGHDEGLRAIAAARADGTPWLAISRQPGAGDLAHGASVRDIADALRTLLLSPRATPGVLATPAPPLPPFLDAIRLDRTGADHVLLENGLLRLVVDRPNGRLHLLRRATLAQVLAAANVAYWRVTPLAADEWQTAHAPEVVDAWPLEVVWWRAAKHIDPALLGTDIDMVGLSAWPDLEPDSTDPQWLPVLAHLQRRDWTPTALASATGIPHAVVEQVAALVRLSGLARRAGSAPATRPGRQAFAPEQMRSFLRIAKRFGLRLMGVQHG